MSEGEAIKAIEDALDPLQADERSRVLAWVHLKYGGVPIPAAAPAATPAAPMAAPAATKAKATKKAKTIIAMDKTLNLIPAGKQSAMDFAAEKAPTNVKEKGVVAVYYLRDIIGMEKVTAQAVFTFFKTVMWPVPADLKNVLQQAGTMGWLDTADSEDIKLTSSGENLVEHSLSAKGKAKA